MQKGEAEILISVLISIERSLSEISKDLCRIADASERQAMSTEGLDNNGITVFVK